MSRITDSDESPLDALLAVVCLVVCLISIIGCVAILR